MIDTGVLRTYASGGPIWKEYERVQKYVRMLRKLTDRYQPTAVLAEIPIGSKNYASSRMFGRMDGVINGLAVYHNIPLVPVMPSEVKKVWRLIPRSKMAVLPPSPNIQDQKVRVVRTILGWFWPELYQRWHEAWQIEAVADAISVAVVGHRYYLSGAFLDN